MAIGVGRGVMDEEDNEDLELGDNSQSPEVEQPPPGAEVEEGEVALAGASLQVVAPDPSPQPNEPADKPVQYAKRSARGDKQDCGWWIDGDYLIDSDGKGVERRTHVGDILEVQTAPAPARFRPWRHQTVLGLRSGRRIEIDNASYVGVANYEDKSAEYAPFVRDLIGVVAAKTPYAKARRGASYLGYVAMLVFVLVLIALVGVLLFLLPIEGVPGINWIKIGLVALMAPPLLAWVLKSRPTGMRLSELPPGALPRAGP